jgi:protein pelota
MKLIKKSAVLNEAGSVTLQAIETEDMWHAYNLIFAGDLVRTVTFRKVVKESSTGSTASQKVKVNLTIEVEKVDFDPEGLMLRLSGKNREETAHVKLGSYHTLELEPFRNFTLTKHCWDSAFLERLQVCTDPAKTADLAAVVMQEGLANLCLVGSQMTIVKSKIEQSIPKKRSGNTGHAKALDRFYEQIMQAIIRNIDFSVVKCVLLASPGFVKDSLHEYMFKSAEKQGIKKLLDNRSKFLLCHTSCGYKHALKEVLGLPEIQAQLSDTKAIDEVRVLENFFKLLGTDPDQAYYGLAHVKRANAALAIDTLMITDTLFRSNSVAERRKYVELVESVRENGGRVMVFSSMHVSGEQLAQLSGVAAQLRYPLPEPEEGEEGASEADSSSSSSIRRSTFKGGGPA